MATMARSVNNADMLVIYFKIRKMNELMMLMLLTPTPQRISTPHCTW